MRASQPLEALETRRLLAATPSVVDVLFLYTPGAVAFHGGSFAALQASLAGAMDTANFALANSRIPVVLRTVGVEPIAYTGSDDLFVDRVRLANPADGFMDGAHMLRDARGADLVSLIVENSFGGGNASLPTSLAELATGNFAFSANAVNSVLRGNLTLAHELGHNLGGGHERGNLIDPAVGPFEYSYGYRFTAQGNLYHDVMSYDPGEVIYSFANPNVSYLGVPTGKPAGDPESADLHATFSQTGPVIAGYRPTVLTDTTAPSAALYAVSRAGRLLDFTVRYADDSGIDASTIGAGDVVVITPPAFGGHSLAAGLLSIEGGAVGGPHKFARYRAILPVEETPTDALNFELLASAVRDAAGNFASPGAIGRNTAHEAWWSFAASKDLGTLNDPLEVYESTAPDAADKWYRFTLDTPATVSIKLTGLSADAGVLLARDVNGNNRYDLPDDFIAGSFNPGNSDESFGRNLAAGTYFVDVFGTVNTGYALSIGRYTDAQPPTAELDAADIAAPTGQFAFNVTFRDNREINADLARFWSPIRLTNPFGGFYIAFPDAIDAPLNAPVRTVTYRFDAGFTLSASDNGLYTVALEPRDSPIFNPPLANYPSDVAGNAVAPATLGTFRVAIGQPDGTAPDVAAVNAPTVRVPVSADYVFDVTYRDNRALDPGTLDGGDLLITGPGGFSTPATLVSVGPAPSAGGLRTATYRFTPPGGRWSELHRGPYAITLRPDEVRDLAGNAAPTGVIGTFDVLVPLPGDADGNGTVNIGDFARLAANFNQLPRGFEDGDFDYSGVVSIADFSILAARFNQSLPGARGAPPPATGDAPPRAPLRASPFVSRPTVASPRDVLNREPADLWVARF